MNYYLVNNALACSKLPGLPLPSAGEGVPELYLLKREGDDLRCSWRVTEDCQLDWNPEHVSGLATNRCKKEKGESNPPLPEPVRSAIRKGELQAIDLSHPHWENARAFPIPGQGKKRVHLLAVGDVGGTLLTALKILGGDQISRIGIYDLSRLILERWEMEMGQISWPWEYASLPEVEILAPEQLFDCDVFLFAATKFIPKVGSEVKDVRMAQYEANRPLVEFYGKKAREANFRGLFVVLSDPVDPLCRAAWRASNTDGDGKMDHLGLLPEQVHGFGLGVMNARAAWFAKKDPRFAAFLTEGRCFGPHGQGLVVANSIENYDDAISRELTERVISANLAVRKLGFKPYIAPAISSGAMQLLLALRGEWHCGSVPMGGIWFGIKNRYTPWGLETERLPLPDPLLDRLVETERILRQIS